MQNAVVAVDLIDDVDKIVRIAGELAAGVDATLYLLHVTSETDYEENREAMAQINAIEGGTYPVGQAEEGAREYARDVGLEVLGDMDVEWEPVGFVGDEYDAIMQTATDCECDHIFLTGEKRSPSGKAIFGDTAQRVILNFDNPVTILTV